MPDLTTSSREATAQAENAAALLALGHSLECFSLALTVMALLALLIAPLPLAPCLALSLAALAGLLAQYFALRTRFDQTIFAAWAHRWQRPEADPGADLAAFDAALTASSLSPLPGGLLRPLADRITGARRLLWRQALCCLLQLGCWIAAILFALLTR